MSEDEAAKQPDAGKKKKLSIGEEFECKTVPGKNGDNDVIGVMKNGTIVLFDRQSPQSKFVLPGMTAACETVRVGEKFIVGKIIRITPGA